MQRKGLEPGMISYSAAISACEKGKQPDTALELLEDMHCSEQCIQKVQDVGVGLAAFRWDAAAPTRAQCDHLHRSGQCIGSAGCRREPCSSSMRCRSRDSSPTDHLHSSGQCIGKFGCRRGPYSSSMGGSSKDSSTTDHLLRSGQRIGKCRTPEKVLQLFGKMLQQGLEPN